VLLGGIQTRGHWRIRHWVYWQPARSRYVTR